MFQSISPGYVETEIIMSALQALGNPDPTVVFPDMATQNVTELPSLKAQDIADGVVYVLSTPPTVQVHELTLKPVGEPF